jgi:hypothetical protein
MRLERPGGGISVSLAEISAVGAAADQRVRLAAKGAVSFAGNATRTQLPFIISIGRIDNAQYMIEFIIGYAGNPPTGGAHLVIRDKIYVNGQNGGLLKGTAYISYPKYEDAPKEGKLLGNILLKALFVLAIVVCVAACVATAGATAVAAGIIIGGAAAVVGTACRDYENGQSRPFEYYLLNGALGAVIGGGAGAIAGGIMAAAGGFSIAIMAATGLSPAVSEKLANTGAYALTALTSIFALNDAISLGYGENVAIKLAFDGDPTALEYYTMLEVMTLAIDVQYMQIGNMYSGQPIKKQGDS